MGSVGLASMSHVLLDRVWRSPASFWWPFQGWNFPRTEGVGIWEQVMMHLRDPLTVEMEIAAAVIMATVVASVWWWKRRRGRKTT